MQTRGYGGPIYYIQGPGVLDQIATHIAPLGKRALLIIDGFFWDGLRLDVEAHLAAQSIACHALRFGGESTDEEIERCAQEGGRLQADVVIGIGGGKTLDTAKITASRIGARIVCVPSIASTDSPTSSIGVVYSKEGVYDRVVRCWRNPDVVLVDSRLIIQAPVRFLSAGMGDALSTWYEARSNAESRSNNYIGGGYATTLAGQAIARACHDTLMRDGRSAYAAARHASLTPAVENIIEANILLSGLGFENCGVSAAHGIHDALTILAPTHKFYHGEKVAFGTLCLLVLENRPLAELHEAIDFCLDVGLPTTLRDFGLQDASAADLQAVGESAMDPANVIHATPVTLSATLVSDVIRTTSALAQQRAQSRNKA